MDRAVEVVTLYLESFATGDADTIAAHVHDDFSNEHLSELGSGCEGRNEYRSRLPGFLATFVGARYTTVAVGVLASSDDVAPSDSDVVVRYRFEADYNGVGIDIPGMMWFGVREGRITRHADLWDSLTFLRQTGQAD